MPTFARVTVKLKLTTSEIAWIAQEAENCGNTFTGQIEAQLSELIEKYQLRSAAAADASDRAGADSAE